MTEPHAETEPEPVDRDRLRRVEEAVIAWKGQLVDLGGRNTLLYFKDLRAGTLDLRSDGHDQVALSRLLASHTVKLSDLFPGDEGRTGAAKRARTIRAKANENFEERGLLTLHLAWGMATWTNTLSPTTPAAPVLLRQAVLAQRGGAGEDFDISLHDDFEINPTLLHVLNTQFKLRVAEEELLDLLAEDAPGLPDADALFARLAKLAADIPGFDVAGRVVVGNFSYAKLPMVNDLDAALEGGQLVINELLAAIAGDPTATATVRGRHPVVSSDEPDFTPPADEFIVLDADASQSYAINTAVKGGDLVVEGPPGTGKSQTIANLIATLAARGKRVLFVAEKRAAIDAVLERLTARGLGELVLDLHEGAGSKKQIAQALAKALAAPSTTPLPNVPAEHARLERRRSELRAWRDALHRPREPWGISVYDVQAELVELRRRNDTDLRISGHDLGSLSGETYAKAAVDLETFAERGGLALQRGDSPWRHAFDQRLVTSTDQVREALDAVTAAARTSLPQAQAALRRVADESGLAHASNLEGWKSVLSLLQAVEATLTVLKPEAFGEPLDDLAVAFASGGRGAIGRATATLTSGAYRAAHKRAEALAIGSIATRDLYAAVAEAAEQQKRWSEHSTDGSPPRAVTNLAGAAGLFVQLCAEVEVLVERTGDVEMRNCGDILLAAKLDALVADQGNLVKIPELVTLHLRLVHAGAGTVVADVARRGLDPDRAVEELRFVWLESVLAELRVVDASVGGFDRETHDRAVSEFRDADVQHLDHAPQRVRRAVAERIVRAREQHPDQSQVVQAEAAKKQRHLPIRKLVEAAPDVLTALKPCWAMSPLVVAQVLPATRLFDVVIFDEASQVTPADAVGALLRADRAIVAGDSKQLPPTSFFDKTSGGGEDDEAAEAEVYADTGIALTKDMESVLDVMRALLPAPIGTKTLAWHYRSRDERLIAFSNAQETLYDWSLTTFPGAGDEPCISHELVPFVAGRIGQEDSVSDEVERVVALIVQHASTRPDESLGVIAMGLKHANRIAERLRQERAERPDLDEFFDLGPGGRARPEPLFMKNLERVQGDERDAIILTVGYGKSADGRMVYRFGPLNQQGGERRLNVAITRARQRMTVVSSFTHEDMDPNKLNAEGARMLCRYLHYAVSGGTHLGDQAMVKPHLNAFERDVRDALTAAGVPLVAQYGCSGYWIDFAAKHPRQEGRMVLAIEADGATYHSGETARDRDRLRQDHLERLGWRFHRIWSTDWFHHRETEIARAVAAWEESVRHADGRTRVLRSPERPVPEATSLPEGAAPARQGRRPALRKGLPIGEYNSRQLADLARWIESDTLLRTEDEVLAEMMRELGFQKRGKNIVAALTKSIKVARSATR